MATTTYSTKFVPSTLPGAGAGAGTTVYTPDAPHGTYTNTMTNGISNVQYNPVVSPGVANGINQAKMAATPPTTAIDGSNLTPQTVPTYPKISTDNTAQTALGATLAASNASTTAPVTPTAPQDTSTSPTNSIVQRMLGDINTLGGQGDYTALQNKAQDIDGKTLKSNNAQKEYDATSDFYDQQIQTLKDNAAKYGAVSTAPIDAQIAGLNADKYQKLARLGTAKAAAEGDLKLAQDTADKAVAAKYEPIKNEIGYLKDLQATANNDLTDSEKLQVAANIKQKEDYVQAAIDKDKAANDEFIKENSPAYALDLQKTKADIAQSYASADASKASAAKSRADTSAVSNAQAQLTAAAKKGIDSYTDPNLYASLRAQSTLTPTDFDNRFGYLVNPASTARLGIGAAATTQGGAFGAPTAQDKSDVMTALGANPTAAASVDTNRLATDPQYFYWVKAQLGAGN